MPMGWKKPLRELASTVMWRLNQCVYCASAQRLEHGSNDGPSIQPAVKPPHPIPAKRQQYQPDTQRTAGYSLVTEPGIEHTGALACRNAGDKPVKPH